MRDDTFWTSNAVDTFFLKIKSYGCRFHIFVNRSNQDGIVKYRDDFGTRFKRDVITFFRTQPSVLNAKQRQNL